MKQGLCYIVFMWMIMLIACQEEYVPETIEADQQIVVEGIVEAGPGSNPVYVLLTRSIPFIGEIDRATIESLFIRNAIVTVETEGIEIQLTEICIDQLPENIRDAVQVSLGLSPDSLGLNICAYVDLLDQVDRKIGKSYSLEVRAGNEVLHATTTIPAFVPIQSFRWDDPPGEPSDSLTELLITIEDPIGENFYRYLTGPIRGPLIPPFASVTNDVFFDGQSFEFPLNKALPRGENIDPETFGLFERGDSVMVKWITLDAEHFNFWSTLEFSANRNGPFASYTRIAGNIEGGLGIWGGYAVDYYPLFAPYK